MADIGLVTAAGNEMTISLARGDRVAANIVFQSALVFVLLSCAFLLVIGMIGTFVIPWSNLTNFDQRVGLAALILSVLLSLLGGLSEAVYKSSGRYALGTNLSNLVRLGEWTGNVLGLISFGTFAAVAIGGLSFRLVGLIATVLSSRSCNQSIRWRFEHASGREVRRLLKPALAFMAFPIANALSLQGMTILIASLLGAGAVAIFNTYRTLARASVQATSIFSHALWVEFGQSVGSNDLTGLKRLYDRAALWGVLIAIVSSAFLYLFGHTLLDRWTHRVIEFRPTLMTIMILYAAVSGSWHVPRVLLMSTNQHMAIAWWSICAGVGSLGITAILSSRWNIEGGAIALLTSEIATAAFGTVLVQTVFKTNGLRATI